MNKTFFSVVVTDTHEDREYWATRSWVSSATQSGIRSAGVVFLPSRTTGRENIPLFPHGSPDIIREVSLELKEVTFEIGIDRDKYSEVVLHADHLRWPTMLVSHVFLPILIGVLANHVDRYLTVQANDRVLEYELIVEGTHGHCISIKYKGPPSQLAETLVKQAEACLPLVETEPRPAISD